MRSMFRFIRSSFAFLPLYSVEVDAGIEKTRALITVGDSVVTAFKALGPLIVDAAGDRAKSVALGEEVTAKAAEWAAAVTENTPAAVRR